LFHPANLPFQCMSHPVRPEKKNLLFFFFFLFPEWYVTNVGFCGQELRLDGASRPSDAAREIAWVSFSLGHSNYPPLDGIAFSTEPAIAPCQPSNGSAQCRRDGSLLVTGAWRMTNQAPHTRNERTGRDGSPTSFSFSPGYVEPTKRPCSRATLVLPRIFPAHQGGRWRRSIGFLESSAVTRPCLAPRPAAAAAAAVHPTRYMAGAYASALFSGGRKQRPSPVRFGIRS